MVYVLLTAYILYDIEYYLREQGIKCFITLVLFILVLFIYSTAFKQKHLI